MRKHDVEVEVETLFFPNLPCIGFCSALQTGKVLQSYSEQMKNVASLLAEDVDRLVESKGVAISMDILANKRTYIQLCAHLRTGEDS